MDDPEYLEMPVPVWLEQMRFLTAPLSARVSAAVTAFGRDVVLYQDADEFADLQTRRVAGESFFPDGNSGNGEEVKATSWMAGTVLKALFGRHRRWPTR